MKKVLVFIILITLLSLIGCKKENRCDSIYKQQEIPSLIRNGYNTCEAVLKNYTYRSCESRNYPNFPFTDDTIKVCGYVYEMWDIGQSLILFDNADNYKEHNFGLCITLPSYELVVENKTKKCYVIGRVSFNELYINGGDYIIVPIVNAWDMYFE